MPRHRTTARGLFLTTLLACGIVAGPAHARPDAPAGKVPQLIFPVVGGAKYYDDFGEARGQGGHEGNDLMAPKRSIAVAAEVGTVKFWTTSSRAGCMLYLDGVSGTKYLYVHLNNDVTRGNDNTGKCIAGVAYARGLKSGDRVEAGQPIAYVGDSGDADGIASHLHFEVHPNDGAAVSPFKHLQRARQLLLAVVPGKPFSAALRGKVVEFDGITLTLLVDQTISWPGTIKVKGFERKVQLAVPETTLVYDALGQVIANAVAATLATGDAATAWTERSTATLGAALGQPLLLATERIGLAAD